MHNETLSVVAMRANNPDCSPFGTIRAEKGDSEALNVLKGDDLLGLNPGSPFRCYYRFSR
jgi:hypothetical protein